MNTLFDQVAIISVILRAPKTKRGKQPDVTDIEKHLGYKLVETGDYTYDIKVSFDNVEELKTFIRRASDHKEVEEWVFRKEDGRTFFFFEEPI